MYVANRPSKVWFSPMITIRCRMGVAVLRSGALPNAAPAAKQSSPDQNVRTPSVPANTQMRLPRWFMPYTVPRNFAVDNLPTLQISGVTFSLRIFAHGESAESDVRELGAAQYHKARGRL